ncbi:MAG: tetratricopeptide repeat protein [Bradyrhizobium sp.]|nr:tetratricopeptide repeat protein [Bradyrhizobium sp.]
MVDIFDEVNEDLRAERAQKLLMRYGGLIVLVAIGIVGAAGTWQAWRWWQSKQDTTAAAAYVSVMTAADSTTPSGVAGRPGTVAALDRIAANAPHGYQILARLRAAALKADTGDAAGASALWDQVAGDTSADPVLRDLASLLWAEHQVDHGDPALVAARLQALAVPGATWRAMAQEQLALLDLRQGKSDQAKDTLRKLSDDVTAPSGVRGRASSLVSKLGG